MQPWGFLSQKTRIPGIKIINSIYDQFVTILNTRACSLSLPMVYLHLLGGSSMELPWILNLAEGGLAAQ